MTEAEKFGAYLRSAREKAGLTQLEMGNRLGINDRTVGRWESGTTIPNVLQARHYMAALGYSPIKSSMQYAAPEHFEKMGQSPEADRAALVHYFSTAATDREISQLLFLIMCEHGSSWPAMLQMYVADAQSPLLERIAVATLIAAQYQIARERDRLVFPSEPQPDIGILIQAIEAARAAVTDGMTSYAKYLVTGGAPVGL